MDCRIAQPIYHCCTQVWLAVFHLLSNSDCRKRYHINAFRKASLLRARKYLNDVMLDQLPVLADIQRYMDELAIMDVPEPAQDPFSNNLLVEQVCAMCLGSRWF